ncbi:MAG TPA: carboxypeptidase regulatory-like domain-containing protein [Blastocatellia bacterium]|nr:carboxypeptidase regulatory-like domain-containing protein [Blastocatellia bacterium]
MRSGLLFMMTAVLTLAVSGNAFPQQGSSSRVVHHNDTIRGKVRSTSGNTVNNAIVDLRVQGGAMIGETVTDTDGDFEFPNLVAGVYEVAVTAVGYNPVVQRAEFNHTSDEDFEETLNIEVVVSPKEDHILGTPGTSFVQNVPKDARAAYEKALAKLADKKPDEAIVLLTHATEVYGEYFNAYYSLAAVYYSTGKLDDALKNLERARQINGRDSAVYQLFGMVMLKEGKLNVAEYAFKQSAGLDPTKPAPHFYRAYVLLGLVSVEQKEQRAKDLAQAENEINSAWDLSNKRLFQCHIQKARMFQMKGDNGAAILELQAYLKEAPNEKDAPEIRKALEELQTQSKK